MAKATSKTTIELDKLTTDFHELLQSLENKKRTERYTEDLFSGFFRIKELGLSSSRDEVPAIKAPSGTWRPDGIVFSEGRGISEVFELKKPNVKICNGRTVNYPSAQVFFQAVRYIAGSHSFKSTQEIKRVFCFNGADLVCVSPVSNEQLALFLKRAPWKDVKELDDQKIEKVLRENSALVEAYFRFEYIASLPSIEMASDKTLFRHHLRHFCDSLLRAVGVETSIVRSTITKANLKEIYKEFCSLVTEKPEEHFVRIAPVWTKNNLFWFGKNGYLHVFQKDGSKVTDIPKGDIKNKDLDAVKRLLESHVLDSPETFYDNYDTLLNPNVRKRLGSYFTKKGLAGFAQYFLFKNVKNLSEFYILDPAAGSGTLLANLKAKGVFGTDIHEFKYSLMRERGVRHFNEPIDFLKTHPTAYMSQLNEATNGDVVRKPLLVLSNPPYLGHSSPDALEETLKAEVKRFKMTSHDLCSFFMVQMTRLFNGDYNGLGKDLDGYIAVFSPTTWVNEDRGDQKEFREYILSQFSYEHGFKVDGSKFFDDMGSPVLFSLLKRRKKVSWKKEDLLVDPACILDLTKSHALVSEVGVQWGRMPEVVKSGFESVERVLSAEEAKKFSGKVAELFSRKSDAQLFDFMASLPKFSKCFKTSHSQTGNNELALSSDVVRKTTKMADICADFKERLKLRLSNEEICRNLQLVFDDRPSLQQGFRFVYLDSSKFATQSIPNVEGPVLNFFEEIRKSHRAAKFYNAAPITTDIAVAQIPATEPETFEKGTCGFKKLTKGSVEEKYLREFSKTVGDARSLFFLRAMISYLPSFKALVNDKSIDSSLVWMPSLNGDLKSLRELLLISFCHSVSTTHFDELNLKYEKCEWRAVDYFSPLGWLKSSGLMKTIYESFSKTASKEVAAECEAAIGARLQKKDFDAAKLLEMADERFAAAGFLKASRLRKVG